VDVGQPSKFAGKLGPGWRSEKWGGRAWMQVSGHDVKLNRAGTLKTDSKRGEVYECECLRKVKGRDRAERHIILPGSTEYQIEWDTLADVPDTGYVDLALEFSGDLTWHKQLALTQEQIDGGAVRPENVLNSYAVFGPLSGRYLRADGSEIINYENGKFCHLYRSCLIDANGNRCWLDQTAPMTGPNRLRVALDLAWLRDATFPVTLDPTFGYTSEGASELTLGRDYQFVCGPFAPASDGDASSVSLYCRTTSGENATFGIFNSTASTKLRDTAGSAVGTTTALHTKNLDSVLAVTSGTNYYLGAGSAATAVTAFYVKYDSVSGIYIGRDFSTSYVDGTLRDNGVGATENSYKVSIYATYTEEAEPPADPGWTVDGIAFTKRKKITIANTNVGETLTDFPLLVQISADANIGAVCQSDGDDLRFTDAAGTLLSAEKESFSVSSGQATGIFWVKVGSISHTAGTDIYCYYGNSGASAQAAPSGVWNSGYKGVWHGKDATTSTIADSTATAATGTKTAANEPVEAAGKINKAQSFDGSNDIIDVGDIAAFQMERTDSFTFQAWIKTSHDGFNRIWHKSKGSSPYSGIWFGKYSTNKAYCELYDAEGDRIGRLGATSINDNAWRLIHATYSGSSASSGINLYVDGVDDDTSDSAGGTFNSSIKYAVSAKIGADTAGGRWNGLIGEIRVSNVVRSANWIHFEWHNQSDSGGNLTWATEEINTSLLYWMRGSKRDVGSRLSGIIGQRRSTLIGR